MLQLAGIAKRYGSQLVLDDVTWTVPDGARVGLTGPNGAGKSTILRIIAGELEPDRGTIALPRGTRVGYLPQHVLGTRGVTVLAQALTAFADLHALAARRAELEHALATVSPQKPEYAALLERYTAVCEEWDHRGRYDTDAEAEAVLRGLGFRTEDLGRDCGELSGGWQMRVALAQLLLRRPDLLLLDEPTNYLDLEARTWLEEFLAAYPGTLVMVAHDRYFLDVTVNHIAEVLHGRVTDYPMTYTRYLEERVERLELARAAYEQQKSEIERIEAFVHRFRYQASKAALVQSRVKQLEKIERLPPPDGHQRTLKLRLPEAPRSGRAVLELTGAAKAYANVRVYEDAQVLVERGQRIAIVGPNGAGKTTLLRLLAGVLPLDGGERRVGHRVALGYFAQDHAEMLDPEGTVLDEIMGAASVDTVPYVRTLLGAFLFSGDAVEKRVGVLSGGERSRLALAKLLVEPTNCLLLDEPTNHLDLTAKEVLLDALRGYAGTLVLVAHDRYLLDQLPTHVIEVGSGRAERYVGNYEDYLRAKASAAVTAPGAPARAAGRSSR
ncbi:MAG: ABC-F family ATP-binding cassette domain-containing protein [Deltaproteobacteria bacterium]|nr:MAG: ABC-F family ATP-binding cassette domain-containing protein [Deltaproteobacteria bacterium]